MSHSLLLKLDILSPWICGTGRGQGRLYDAVSIRDHSGLPYVPGRHLKGLLREAVERMPTQMLGGEEASGPEIADFLFGPRANADDRQSAANYFFGLLHFSSATLSDAEKSHLKDLSAAQLETALFLATQSTAIDQATGSAKDKSLRSQLMAIPMPLYATIEADPNPFQLDNLHPFEQALIDGGWKTVIQNCAALVRAIGANRHRGAGRVVLTALQENLA